MPKSEGSIYVVQWHFWVWGVNTLGIAKMFEYLKCSRDAVVFRKAMAFVEGEEEGDRMCFRGEGGSQIVQIFNKKAQSWRHYIKMLLL